MKRLIVRPPRGSTARFYTPESLAGKLESALLANGIHEIGSMKELNEWYDKTDYMRARAISMNDEDRVLRAASIKRLRSMDQLTYWHDLENVCGEFLQLWQIEKRLGFMNTRLKLTDEVLADIGEKITKVMPAFSKITVAGIEYQIPPYFLYDLNFDGMVFHHAFDKNIFFMPGDLI